MVVWSRRVSRTFTIRLGREVATAILLEDRAPETCAAFWAALPLQATINHAKHAGPEFFFIVPLMLDMESPVVAQEAGNLGYYPLRQTVCVFYGDTPGVGAVTPFAKIVTNLEGIAREGRRSWDKQGERVVVERDHESPDPTVHHSGTGDLFASRAEALHADSKDIRALLQKKGSYGSSLFHVLSAEADSRALVTALWVMRDLAKSHQDARISVTTAVSRLLSFYSVSFAATYDMEETAAVLRDVQEIIDKSRSPEEVIDVLSSALFYIGKLNYIIDQLVSLSALADAHAVDQRR
jgi:hypothetical protein